MHKITKKRLQKLRDAERELCLLNDISSVLQWDQYTIMPAKAAAQRAEQLAYISSIEYEKNHSKDFADLINKLHSPRILKTLPRRERTIVQKRFAERKKYESITAKIIQDEERAQVEGYSLWIKARTENKPELFLPALKKHIRLAQKRASLMGKDSYEALLYDYEGDSITVSELDSLLNDLKEEVISILGKIKSTKEYKFYKNPLTGLTFDIKGQKAVCKRTLDLMGIDEKRSAVCSTIHPFMSALSFDDKRIATSYRENDLMWGIGSLMHEAGHCMYELGFDKSLENTCLHDAASMAMHESQSRLWENQVGLSSDFWQFYYQYLVKHFPRLSKITSMQFYRVINTVRPSVIRLESDELHYCLHIIIRYEIERDLVSGKLKVDNIFEEWDKKHVEYFGMKPPPIAEKGLLQDVHWAEGMFGYFPTYVLGNIYSGMIWNRLLTERPETPMNLKAGNLRPIAEWLRIKIHKHGATYSPDLLLKKVCKEDITPKHYLDYLKNKYYNLYEL